MDNNLRLSHLRRSFVSTKADIITDIYDVCWEIIEGGIDSINLLHVLNSSFHRRKRGDYSSTNSGTEDPIEITATRLLSATEARYCSQNFLLYIVNLKRYYDKMKGEGEGDAHETKVRTARLSHVLVDLYFLGSSDFVKINDLEHTSEIDLDAEPLSKVFGWFLCWNTNPRCPMLVVSVEPDTTKHIVDDWRSHSSFESLFSILKISFSNLKKLARHSHPAASVFHFSIYGLLLVNYCVYIIRFNESPEGVPQADLQAAIDIKESPRELIFQLAIIYSYLNRNLDFLRSPPADFLSLPSSKLVVHGTDWGDQSKSGWMTQDEVAMMDKLPQYQNGDILQGCDGSTVRIIEPMDVIGCNASVYLATILSEDGTEGSNVIVKVVSTKPRDFSHDYPSEVFIYKLLGEHRNLAKFVDWCWIEDKHFFTVILEYIPSSEVPPAVENQLYHSLIIARDTADATCFLHEKGVVHRDIKPRNIVYDLRKKRAALIDFDIAFFFGPSEADPEGKAPTGEVGTRGYKAPELDPTNPYDTSIDIWSLGVSLAEMALGIKVSTFAPRPRSAMEYRATILVSISVIDQTSETIKGIIELVETMLSVDPSERPTALQVREALDRLLLTGFPEESLGAL